MISNTFNFLTLKYRPIRWRTLYKIIKNYKDFGCTVQGVYRETRPPAVAGDLFDFILRRKR